MYCYQKRTRDFIEMTLHEILTIYLYAGCYLTNFWEIGTTVSFLHAASDFLGMLTKAFGESRFGKTTATLFVIEILIWFYTRLLVFPWIAWVAATQDIDMGHWLILPFFGYGLFCLVFMHAYWFNLFIQILIHYIKKGETDDKIEADVESNSNGKGQELEDENSGRINTEGALIHSQTTGKANDVGTDRPMLKNGS